MPDADTPQTSTPADSKKVWQSKTFWLQVITILSALLPAVRDFLEKNPVEFLAVLGAINLLVRFATSGRLVIFGDEKDSGAGSGGNLLPLLICMATVCLAGGLSSCSAEYPITGSLVYRDPDSGAKGGLVFAPGKAPVASVRVPIYDDAGNLTGWAELSGPLAKEVNPTK